MIENANIKGRGSSGRLQSPNPRGLVADRLVANRFVADRFVPNRFVADGLVANRLVANRFVADGLPISHQQFSTTRTANPTSSIIQPIVDRQRFVIMDSPCLEYNNSSTNGTGLVCFHIIKPLLLCEVLTTLDR